MNEKLDILEELCQETIINIRRYKMTPITDDLNSNIEKEENLDNSLERLKIVVAELSFRLEENNWE